MEALDAVFYKRALVVKFKLDANSHNGRAISFLSRSLSQARNASLERLTSFEIATYVANNILRPLFRFYFGCELNIQIDAEYHQFSLTIHALVFQKEKLSFTQAEKMVQPTMDTIAQIMDLLVGLNMGANHFYSQEEANCTLSAVGTRWQFDLSTQGIQLDINTARFIEYLREDKILRPQFLAEK